MLLAIHLHPMPVEMLDRYARFIRYNLAQRINRPQTLLHLETLLQHEQTYLTRLTELTFKGKHYTALAALSDEEIEALDVAAELESQQNLVAILEGWQADLLAFIVGETEEETLYYLETNIAEVYFCD